MKKYFHLTEYEMYFSDDNDVKNDEYHTLVKTNRIPVLGSIKSDNLYVFIMYDHETFPTFSDIFNDADDEFIFFVHASDINEAHSLILNNTKVSDNFEHAKDISDVYDLDRWDAYMIYLIDMTHIDIFRF